MTAAGAPIVGAVPVRLIVYGGIQMTARQGAMLQAAYASFKGRARLAVFPNSTEQGLLPDGSRYTFAVIGASVQACVWPIGGEAEETGDSGVLVRWPDGEGTLEMLLKPGGKLAQPNGKWKAVVTTGRQRATLSGWVPTDRPVSAALTWHSPVSREYYVLSGGTNAERYGIHVVTADSIAFDSARSSITAVGSGASKQFVMAHMSPTEAQTFAAPAVATGIDQGPFPKPLAFEVGPPFRTAAHPKVLTGMALAPTGTQAMVTEIEIREPVPVPHDTLDLRTRQAIPYWQGIWTPEINVPNGGLRVNRQIAEVQPKTTVFQHEQAGGTWSDGSALYLLAEGSSTPETAVYRYVLEVPSLYSGGVTTRFLQHPTRVYNSPAGDSCSFTGSVDITTLTDNGPIHYTETQRYDSGEWVNNQQPFVLEASGVWYGVGGQKFKSPQRTRYAYDMELSATYSANVVERFTCDSGTTSNGAGVSSARNEDGTMSRSMSWKTTVDANGTEFVVYEVAATETNNYTSSYSGNTDTGLQTQSLQAAITMNSHGLQRTVLCYDPQFSLLVYLEAQWDYTRTPTGTLVRHTAGGVWVNDVLTAGDTADPPVRPRVDLVIQIGGNVVLRDVQPDDDAEITHPADGIIHDAALPFVSTQRAGGADTVGPTTGSTHFLLLNGLGEPGFWLLPTESVPFPGPEPIDKILPHLGSIVGTLGRGQGPLTNPATASITCRYGKDPRTGGAVLSLQRTASSHEYAKAFLIDGAGLKPLSSVAPDIPPPEINLVAAS